MIPLCSNDAACLIHPWDVLVLSKSNKNCMHNKGNFYIEIKGHIHLNSHQGKIRSMCELWDGVWSHDHLHCQSHSRLEHRFSAPIFCPLKRKEKNHVALCSVKYLLVLKIQDKCYSVLELLELNNLDIK